MQSFTWPFSNGKDNSQACTCCADLASGRSNQPGATASPAGRKLLQTANPVQTAAGNAQTLEDEANADAADTLIDDAFGTYV